MRTVTIAAALNGIKVQVGCTELVFNHVEEFITAFRAYVANPQMVEKEWLSRYDKSGSLGQIQRAEQDQCSITEAPSVYRGVPVGTGAGAYNG
jgi:type IV secretory pathway TrbF-like protein